MDSPSLEKLKNRAICYSQAEEQLEESSRKEAQKEGEKGKNHKRNDEGFIVKKTTEVSSTPDLGIGPQNKHRRLSGTMPPEPTSIAPDDQHLATPRPEEPDTWGGSLGREIGRAAARFKFVQRLIRLIFWPVALLLRWAWSTIAASFYDTLIAFAALFFCWFMATMLFSNARNPHSQGLLCSHGAVAGWNPFNMCTTLVDHLGGQHTSANPSALSVDPLDLMVTAFRTQYHKKALSMATDIDNVGATILDCGRHVNQALLYETLHRGDTDNNDLLSDIFALSTLLEELVDQIREVPLVILNTYVRISLLIDHTRAKLKGYSLQALLSPEAVRDEFVSNLKNIVAQLDSAIQQVERILELVTVTFTRIMETLERLQLAHSRSLTAWHEEKERYEAATSRWVVRDWFQKPVSLRPQPEMSPAITSVYIAVERAWSTVDVSRNMLKDRRKEFAQLRDTMQSMTITTELINIELHLKTLETIAELFREKYALRGHIAVQDALERIPGQRKLMGSVVNSLFGESDSNS